MPGGNTRTTLFVAPSPPYAVRGEGCWVEDQTGHVTLDCNNNYTSLIHGHAHPTVVAAVCARAAAGTAFGIPTSSEIELAEHLAARTGIAQWRFGNSGTEAVMMAIRAARAYTGRDLVVRFNGSYHGTYDAVAAAGAPGVPAAVAATSLSLEQGDGAAFARCMQEHGRHVAAVLLDLMPNRGGLTPVDDDFVQQVREITIRTGTLLVIDEVITFRLAEGGMHTRYGVTPDLITVGKVIGGGLPIGAVGGSSEVMSVFDPIKADGLTWGGTFSGNPMSMVAGLAALREYGQPEIVELNRLGDDLRVRLREAGLDVSGSGSLLRLLEPVGSTEFWWHLYSAGVLACTNGLLSLSTPMGEPEIDRIGDAIIDVIRSRTTRV